jgi:UbiD family decarboxylase
MATLRKDALPRNEPDMEAFRLRSFVQRLIAMGECEVVEQSADLADLAAKLDGNGKAVLFRKAGPEAAELVGNVCASRTRLAAAFETDVKGLRAEVSRRIGVKQELIEIPSAQAPVHQIVLKGKDVDLSRFPVHLQHGLDGGPYFSSSIDYSLNPDTGETNIGIRRLMLRSRTETGIDLVAPSDLRAIFMAAHARGQHLPVAFALGSHPIDHVAATLRLPGDELSLLANLRGTALPVVKCITSDIRVAADAEIVIEGYLDSAGYVEPEGPYGEFFGTYGVVKQNPVFKCTAITMRRDALFQTATIGGKTLSRTDTAQLSSFRTEVMVWAAVQSAVREPLAIYACPSSSGIATVRLSMRQRVPGEARNAIAAAFGSQANIKHIFVVDEDIDIHSDEQMDWAFGTRFQADRDLIVEGGFRAVPIDPSLLGARIGAKAGFDCTLPIGRAKELEFTIPAPPKYEGKKFPSVRDALKDGPKPFVALMAATGSRDGREIALALEDIRKEGKLTRLKDGEYALKG